MLSDIKKWKTEVEPLVGKTQIYAYPYGEWGTRRELLRSPTTGPHIRRVFTYLSAVGNERVPYYNVLPYLLSL